jgi:imidazolonepropionase-like amidohydrolase
VSYRERRRWTDASTTVTDDPRRLPTAWRDTANDPTVVLAGGRVFKATGEPAAPGTVVFRGNRIIAILPPGDKSWPADAKVYDVAGHTVMPGLIDAHIHMTYTEPNLPMDIAHSASDSTLRAFERLRYYVESGVTAIRDAASKDDVPFRLKAWISANRLPLPRIFACGVLITGKGGHGAERLSPVTPGLGEILEVSGPDEWRNAVREQVKKGADVIKIASHFSREELAAAVDEAHTLGFKVMCDAEAFYVDWAVDAGIDTLEHPLPRTDEAIRKMAEKGIQAVPTLVPYTVIFDLFGGYFGSLSRRFTFSKEANLEVVRKMRKAGVKMGIGTDIVMDWFRYMPDAYLRELALFIEAGYTLPEALEAATRDNADILDMGHLLGTLEPGKLADILVVKGSPDQKLEDLLGVNLVFRDGHLIVQDGRLYIERHVGWKLPEPAAKPKGPWFGA